MSAPDRQIVRLPIDALVPMETNAKIHTDAQIAKIAESIRTFGFNDPVEIWHGNLILAGEGRWRAAKSLGMTEIDTISLDHLSADDARAYAIAHNQTTLASGLDMDKVADEFGRMAIQPEEYPALGFSADEVVFMMPEQREILDNEEIRSPIMDVDAWSHLVPKAIRSKIVFDNQLQQARFEQFVDRLRTLYPEEATVADRIVHFIREFCPAQEAL